MIKGPDWMQWDIKADKMLLSHKDSQQLPWYSQLPPDFSARIDASFTSTWGEWQGPDEVYLFSGRRWMRLSLATMRASHGPYENSESPWSNILPAPLNTKIDAAVNVPPTAESPSDVYLFSGDHYARWDFIKDHMKEFGRISKTAKFASMIQALGTCE